MGQSKEHICYFQSFCESCLFTQLCCYCLLLIVAPSTNGDAKPEITEQDQQVQEGKLMYLFWLRKYPNLPHQSFLSSCDHLASLGNSISHRQLTITLDSDQSDFLYSMFSLGVPSENVEPSNNQSAQNMDQESKFLFGCVYQEVSNLPYYHLFLFNFNFPNLE